MTVKLVRGVAASVLTPRLADGSVDTASQRNLLEFLLGKGISSFALNGATGEFCITTPTQLRTLLKTAKEVAGNAAEFLCGVGVPDTAGPLCLRGFAQDAGVKAALLPMPYFFLYQQGSRAVQRRRSGSHISTRAALQPAPIHLRFAEGNGTHPDCRSAQHHWDQRFRPIARDTASSLGAKDRRLQDSQ
jgi:hypothetical protein